MAPRASKYLPSTLVWARKNEGPSPCWPAVITHCPVSGDWERGKGREKQFHCTHLVLGKQVWLGRDKVKVFTREVGERKRLSIHVRTRKFGFVLMRAIKMAWEILRDPNTAVDYLVEEETDDQMEEEIPDELLNKEGRKGKWGRWEVSTEDNFADPIYINTPYEQPPKNFLCDVCEKAFGNKGSLTNHKNLYHK
jgi:hypothetical protein